MTVDFLSFTLRNSTFFFNYYITSQQRHYQTKRPRDVDVFWPQVCFSSMTYHFANKKFRCLFELLPTTMTTTRRPPHRCVCLGQRVSVVGDDQTYRCFEGTRKVRAVGDDQNGPKRVVWALGMCFFFLRGFYVY